MGWSSQYILPLLVASFARIQALSTTPVGVYAFVVSHFFKQNFTHSLKMITLHALLMKRTEMPCKKHSSISLQETAFWATYVVDGTGGFR